MHIGKNFFIGLFFDLFDWVILGFVPLLGDIVDLLAAIYWYRKVGVIGALAGIEFVPFLDILPTNIVIGLYADSKEGSSGKGGKK